MSAYLFPCCAAAKSNRHATSSRAACNPLSLTAGFAQTALELRRRHELHVRISARPQELPVRRHDVASSARDSGFDEPQVTRVLQASVEDPRRLLDKHASRSQRLQTHL